MLAYEFPRIETIDDVLPHVEGRDDFIIADKGEYIVINYLLAGSETFGQPYNGTDVDSTIVRLLPNDTPVWRYGDLIRRECRGIIFDKATGKLIARRFHKFFNVNERYETLIEHINLSHPHSLLSKVDGSMITAFMTSDNVLRWGTKMGETDIALQAKLYAERNPDYIAAALDSIKQGYTLIFEWCSIENQVVIAHAEPKLILLAARNTITGQYVDYSVLKELASFYPSVEMVSIHDSYQSVEQMIDEVKHLVDQEGFIVRFDNGHMVKIKTDWYLAIHKAKDNILYERFVVQMILNQTIDDIFPYLTEVDREHITHYIDDFLIEVNYWKECGWENVKHSIYDLKHSRKEFALTTAKTLNSLSSIAFNHFDQIQNGTFGAFADWDAAVNKMLLSKTNSNSGWNAFKAANLLDITYRKHTHGELK